MSKGWQIVLAILLVALFSWWLTTEEADQYRGEAAIVSGS